MTPVLTEEHTAKLSAAAITPDIAASAGVRTVETAEDLPEELLCWAESGLPGIVFPWHPADGGEPIHQLYPDTPILKADGARAKYVFGSGASMVLNTHPLMRPRVVDPATPLVMIEGTKQYLAGVSALASGNLAAVGLSGCYGWSQSGAPVPDLRSVAWDGRLVFLCLDADVSTNRDVWSAAERLIGWLKAAGAAEVRLVELPGGANTGLDDVLAQVPDPIETMHRLLDAAKDKLPRRPARRKSGTYFDEDGGLLAEKAASALLDEHPCALAADGTIAVYDAGRYVVERDALTSYVADMLGDRHRPIHAATVTQMVTSKLLLERRKLTDRPRTHLLNVRNGMLNLLTGELHPHSPDYLSVAQLPVVWDPDATCPTYERWLAEVIDDEQCDDLEEVASTMLDPSRTPHKSMFLFGPSRSGKSTFLRVMRAVAGVENTAGVTLHQLADDRFAAAALYGKTLNVAADLSSRHIEDLSVWKMLTGEDLISANLKYGRMFDFVNQALFAFSANELPTVSEASRAYFERIKPFKFAHSFAGQEDPALEEAILKDELPGVLRRWQRAFARLRTRGQFRSTAAGIEAEFETSSDRVRLWMSEEMSVVTEVPATSGAENGPDERNEAARAVSEGSKLPPRFGTAPTKLLELFVAWAKDNGYTPIGRKKFVERLTSMNGVVSVRLLPASTRGFNIIKRSEDQEWSRSGGRRGSLGCTVSMGLDYTKISNDGSTESDQPEVSKPYRAGCSETAPSAPSAFGDDPVRLAVTALTVPVYEAIKADPLHATEARIRGELGLSQTEYKAERDYLASRGAIRRRKGRGFEVLRDIEPAVTEYRPLADPVLVADADGLVSDIPLLEFPEPACAICGEDDDGTSYYFPLCSTHRLEAAS
ncbi:MAG: phage/plasmid primase, P4 family [Pseudonocardiaceae bacterium]